MEDGFIKADSSNLIRLDLMMLGEFLSSNKDFCSAEFRNVKTSISSRPSYGDDAVSYVQLKRDKDVCIVKAKICPEHKLHGKPYRVTLIVDEGDESVKSMQCNDCVASQGGCKHAIAFLMWVHRRSEEPSCTSVECYWTKSTLSRVGTTIKYITAKELGDGKPSLPSNSSVLEKFLEEGKKRKLNSCELIKYQVDYVGNEIDNVSMHKLVLKFKEKSPDAFLEKVLITDDIIAKVEKETREQHQSSLWHELRYGKVTASRAFEFSRCKTSDGTLIAQIMGGKFPDTQAMKRGKMLEEEVRNTVSSKLGKIINKCGLILSKTYPMLAGSPDGVFNEGVIEIKCPTTIKAYKNYIKNNKPTQKFYIQIQLQMLLAGLQKGYFCEFCVADCNFDTNKNVEILEVTFDEKFVSDFGKVLTSSWKDNVYPLLYRSC